jgi:hypothetical protein
VASYDLNIEDVQQSILDHLADIRPVYSYVPDGFIDGKAPETTTGGAIKPFVVIWFRGLRREGARRGTRAVSGARMDAHSLGFDLVCVASNGTTARTMLNDLNNLLIGWKPLRGGQLVADGALWEASRPVIDADNRPTRWAATARYSFGVSAKALPPIG